MNTSEIISFQLVSNFAN